LKTRDAFTSPVRAGRLSREHGATMPQPLNDVRGADPDPGQRASLAGASSRLGLEYQLGNWHAPTASAKQCELVSAGRRSLLRRPFRLRVGQLQVEHGRSAEEAGRRFSASSGP